MPPQPPNSAESSRQPPIQIPDHQLVRRIGDGSYGEVWLACNLLGAFRAVKIIRRSADEDARAYGREFDGIKRYEPFSRGQEGLVDVLHIGRDPDGEFFYYVMELADDAVTRSVLTPGSKTDTYVPRTLREYQRQVGRLPVASCLEIGARIATALRQLHVNGLVHRDIKPSNVIFVNGQPKLADVGLLAGRDEAKTYVGTEGFVAPEGPGTAQADIYSCGKLLYEMATGLDRTEFPKLPVLPPDESEDVSAFAELNEILLRACDPDPSRRYASADELRKELILLQGGRSVRQLRLIERRASVARKVAWTTAAAAGIAAFAYFGSFRQIQRAQSAEKKALATVETLQLQQSEDYFRRDDSSSALAILAHLMRNNPANRVVVERLLAALTWRNFSLPQTQPIQPAGRPRMALFNADDSEVLTTTLEGSLQSWDARSGRLKNESTLDAGRIYWMDLSPDGKLAAVAGQGYAALVETATLEPTVPIIRPGTNRLNSVNLSADRHWMIIAGHDKTCQLWDISAGKQVGTNLMHESSVRYAEFSPDSTRVVTGTRNGIIRVWGVPSGKLLLPTMMHTSIVWKATFSPDGRVIASASDDHEARLWDANTGTLRSVLRHKNCVADVNFSPDGTKVVTASEDLTAVIWDVATGRPIGNPLRHRNWVRRAAFSPDGERVLTASEDNTTRIWDAETTEPIIEPMRHPAEVSHAAFSHSGKSVVASIYSASAEEVWVWDVGSQGAHGWPLLTQDRGNEAKFSKDGRRIAVACKGGSVRLWDRANYRFEETSLPHGREVQHIAFSHDGTLLASVQDNEAWVWDLSRRIRIGRPMVHLQSINSIEFNNDGTRVLTASADGFACIWDSGSGEPVVVLPPPHFRSLPNEQTAHFLFNASFSPDGSLVVTASRNKRATVWDAITGELLEEFEHDHWVTHAEFSPDGESVLTASIDRSAKIWDVATGLPRNTALTHDSDLRTAHFSPDGKRVITTSMDWTARIWNSSSGKPVSDLLRHLGPARVAAFSATGNYAATGADDGLVRLWDANTGFALNEGFAHSSPIESLSFSPDGECLLVVPEDGNVTLYELLAPVYPAPLWLAELAEAVAGQHLGSDGKLESTSPKKFFELREQMSHKTTRGFYARWASWFLENSDNRTISPRARITVKEFAQRKVESGTVESLRQALLLMPTNAVAHARLAQLLSSDELAASSRMASSAAWHIAYAASLAPADGDLLAIRKAIESRLLKSETVARRPLK